MRPAVPALFAVIAFGCGDPCDLSAEETEQDATAFAAFDETVEAFLVDNAENIEGVGAIVVHEECGVLHRKAYGAFTEDRDYLIASVSKMLSAGILVSLADDGLLDLDAPMADYLPEGFVAPHKAQITTAQVLSHSSGLPGDFDVDFNANANWGAWDRLYCSIFPLPSEQWPTLESDPEAQWPFTDDLMGCANAIGLFEEPAGLVVPPNTEFRYASAYWQLVGAVAEVVSGQSWAELVQDRYGDRCDLDVLGYESGFSSLWTMWAYPQHLQGDAANAVHTLNPQIAGGAYTNLDDLGKILLMHLRDGQCGETRVLAKRSVRRMRADRIAEYGGTTTDYFANRGVEGHGLGWFIDRDDPAKVVHGGSWGAEAWLDTRRGYGAFLAMEWRGETGYELRRLVTPHLEEVFDK